MHVDVNLHMVNEAGVSLIAKAVSAKGAYFVNSEDTLMAVKLPSGSVLIASPISTINPLAPPVLFIRGKSNHRMDNRRADWQIIRALRPACKSKYLPEAVKMMKSAIDAISK